MFLVPTVPASIYKVSEDITVNEGSNVTLSCLASGRPDPAITWRLLNPSGKNRPICTHHLLGVIFTKIKNTVSFMTQRCAGSAACFVLVRLL